MHPVEIVAMLIVILIAIIGVFAMKKVDPENKVYPIYAAVVIAAFLGLTYVWFG